MSVRSGSLETYQKFYNGESPLLSTEIEGMLQFAGLNNFFKEIKVLLSDSSPYISQTFLLFTYYRRQLLNLHKEALNSSAASKLLEAFGVAEVGINQETGEVDTKITNQILEVHENLVTEVKESSAELPASAVKFSSFIATMQRSIVELLIKSQEASLIEIDAKEEDEERVEQHLKNHSGEKSIVIYESVEASKAAQQERKRGNFEKRKNLRTQLEVLFSFAEQIFTPAKIGTRGIMTMAA